MLTTEDNVKAILHDRLVSAIDSRFDQCMEFALASERDDSIYGFRCQPECAARQFWQNFELPQLIEFIHAVEACEMDAEIVEMIHRLASIEWSHFTGNH